MSQFSKMLGHKPGLSGGAPTQRGGPRDRGKTREIFEIRGCLRCE